MRQWPLFRYFPSALFLLMDSRLLLLGFTKSLRQPRAAFVPFLYHCEFAAFITSYLNSHSGVL